MSDWMGDPYPPSTRSRKASTGSEGSRSHSRSRTARAPQWDGWHTKRERTYAQRSEPYRGEGARGLGVRANLQRLTIQHKNKGSDVKERKGLSIMDVITGNMGHTINNDVRELMKTLEAERMKLKVFHPVGYGKLQTPDVRNTLSSLWSEEEIKDEIEKQTGKRPAFIRNGQLETIEMGFRAHANYGYAVVAQMIIEQALKTIIRCIEEKDIDWKKEKNGHNLIKLMNRIKRKDDKVSEEIYHTYDKWLDERGLNKENSKEVLNEVIIILTRDVMKLRYRMTEDRYDRMTRTVADLNIMNLHAIAECAIRIAGKQTWIYRQGRAGQNQSM